MPKPNTGIRNSKHSITVPMTDTQWEYIYKAAFDTRLSKSAFIRQLIDIEIGKSDKKIIKKPRK